MRISAIAATDLCHLNKMTETYILTLQQCYLCLCRLTTYVCLKTIDKTLSVQGGCGYKCAFSASITFPSAGVTLYCLILVPILKIWLQAFFVPIQMPASISLFNLKQKKKGKKKNNQSKNHKYLK